MAEGSITRRRGDGIEQSREATREGSSEEEAGGVSSSTRTDIKGVGSANGLASTRRTSQGCMSGRREGRS